MFGFFESPSYLIRVSFLGTSLLFFFPETSFFLVNFYFASYSVRRIFPVPFVIYVRSWPTTSSLSLSLKAAPFKTDF